MSEPGCWHRLSTLLFSALCMAASLSMLACSWTRLESSELVAIEAERENLKETQQKLEKSLKQQGVANQRLQKKLAQLQSRKSDNLATLQFRLLEKEAQLKDLNARLEEAILEVVRAKAKLRSLRSKAEAASNLAEAEIAMNALKAKTGGRAQNPHASRAETLLTLGAKEFKKENYGGALYLSGQAKSLIREGAERSTSGERLPLLRGEVAFVLPVPLHMQRAGNLRAGPGVSFEAIAKMKTGARLLGHSYKGRWVRVRAEDGLTGWVFHGLVNGM